MASWNPVLNFFIETKADYIEKFGEEHLFDYDENKTTCIEAWAEATKNARAQGILENLILREWQGLLLFHYGYLQDQIVEAPTGKVSGFWDAYDGIYMECRSVVIDIHKDTLVLTPFRKFRNLGECEENSEKNIARRIKGASLFEVSNKLDGSMQSARFYEGKIVISGSKTLNPENSFQLAEGNRWINEDPRYGRFLRDFDRWTAIFEHISMSDKHIVVYGKEDEGLHLIGMRNVDTGEEASYKTILKVANEYDLPTTNLFDESFEEVIDNLDKKTSDEAEGFVLNIDGYKVKVKYDDFVDMHSILAAMSSPNVVIRQIGEGTWDDFYSKIPESYRPQVDEIASRVFRFAKTRRKEVENAFSRLSAQSFDNKRDAMIWINENVPKEIQGYVRSKYLGLDIDVLKRAKAWVKMGDIEAWENAKGITGLPESG